MMLSLVTGLIVLAGLPLARVSGQKDAFMRNAALEFAVRNIRVNSVNPSRVNTNIVKNAVYSEEEVAKDIQTYPLKRYAEPEEIANAIII